MLSYQVKKVENAHPISVSVPGSKSITNRALLLAALANGTSKLKGVLFSDDSRHFIQALIDLKFPVVVDEEKKEVTITGFGGCVPVSNQNEICNIQVGSAGTAARFLTAYLGLSEGKFQINSSDQMKKRPMEELLIALEQLGASITYLEERYHFPFVIGNDGYLCDEVEVDVDKSSQFLSALLISSVLFPTDFTIHVKGNHGMDYVKMTVEMMRQFGVSVSQPDNKTFVIKKGSKYVAREYQIEPDVSAACYFYAMSPLLKVSSKVFHVHWDSLQGDIKFLKVLQDMGCQIEEEPDGIKVLPCSNIKGGNWDLSAFSDQTLTLAAIAPFATEKVCILHIGHIQFQECNRVNAIIQNLTNLGIQCECDGDNITINPGMPVGNRILTYDDHRVAMSFSLVGLCVDDVIIENPGCCRKTFENYFEVLEKSVY